MKTFKTATVLLLSASVCLADANVQQKTQVNIAGAIGAIVNVFSRSAREGVTSDTIVKGNRKLTRSGEAGELIDLSEEKVYTIDFSRSTYTVTTFAQLRKEFEEQQQRAKREAEKSKNEPAKKEEGPEYEVEFDVKSTGAKQTINGFDTKETIATVTVHEKGKKLEQSGGWVLTSDMWMGPKLSAMNEIYEFDRKFMTKVYGSAIPDMRQIAMAMMATPAFGKAMKVFNDKRSALEGTAILTKMTFETVVGSDPSTHQQQAKAEEESSPTSVSSAVIGGLMGRMKKRQEEKKAAEGKNPNRNTLFDSTTEVTRATATAAASDVAIPATFKQR